MQTCVGIDAKLWLESMIMFEEGSDVIQSHRSFAGHGGLSLGLKKTGFDIIAAVEMDSDAGEISANIGNHTEIEDITKFSPKKLRRSWNLMRISSLVKTSHPIAGGPPCRVALIGRSKIMDLIKGEYGDGKDARHSFIDDPRNLFSICEICKRIQTRLFCDGKCFRYEFISN